MSPEQAWKTKRAFKLRVSHQLSAPDAVFSPSKTQQHVLCFPTFLNSFPKDFLSPAISPGKQAGQAARQSHRPSRACVVPTPHSPAPMGRYGTRNGGTLAVPRDVGGHSLGALFSLATLLSLRILCIFPKAI